MTSYENSWKNWNLHGENYTPPPTSAPCCFSVLGWIWWRHSTWSGSHHLVGRYVTHTRTSKVWSHDSWRDVGEWGSNPNGYSSCSYDWTIRRGNVGQDRNSGVDGISHQRGEFSVFDESKLQKLLWGISFLFSLFMLPALKDTGNCKCFLDDDISTFNYIISICWLESRWRRSERRTFFFFFLKDLSVSFMKLDV